MSDEEEYDDELPPISVNSTPRGRDLMSMPSADTLASQRAREEECERELQQLRADHDADVVVALAHGDSSGSEGEAALSAAVTALRVKPTLRSDAPALRQLLPALLQRLPVPAALYADVVGVGDQELLALTEEVCSAVPLVRGWWEAAVAAAWACAASVCRPPAPAPAPARPARRALRQLLEGGLFAAATPEELEQFTTAIVSGVESCEARLELSDAASASAAPAAAALAAAALRAALADLTGMPPAAPGECLCVAASRAGAGAWRAAGARGVRVAGRVLRACRGPAPGPACPGAGPGCPAPGPACGPARARLLAALAAPPPPRAAAAPERLEVLVGASKLQLLFRD